MEKSRIQYRAAEIFLFDTCSHKCAYCHFAESGKVLDRSQMLPFKDPEFIKKFTTFFSKRTTANQKWHLFLTGGEPLLMPNFNLLADRCIEDGNKISMNTAMLVGDNHPSLLYLFDKGYSVIDHLMVSFHAEAEKIEDKFFDRLRRLKEAGIRVIFRFIAHPQRFERLDDLSERCRQLDICFFVTPLYSPQYPDAYTRNQKDKMLSKVVTLSQIVLLENGIDTENAYCTAGRDLISIDMRTGNITPCISVSQPVLGNLYDDTLELSDKPRKCPAEGSIGCICEIHFHEDIVNGAHDSVAFAEAKGGFTEPKNVDIYYRQLRENQLQFSRAARGTGQTRTADSFVALDNSTVKATYLANKDYFEGAYAAGFHPEFRSRQRRSSEAHVQLGDLTNENMQPIVENDGPIETNESSEQHWYNAATSPLRSTISSLKRIPVVFKRTLRG
jgi:MoaA/NifB/PqqE/SkfB family radical SAM enzyme